MNKNPKFSHLAIYKFKAGQSGNVNGRPKSYVTVLKELGYTKPVIATMVAEIMFMTGPEVNRIACSNTEPVIRVLIASAFRRGVYKSDYKYIESFMNILFGRNIPFIPGSIPTDEQQPE